MADQGTIARAPAETVAHTSLILALCAAQAEFEPVLKEHVNLHLKSKYATLDAVLDAVRPALNRNGLVLIQPARMEEQLLVVDTTIIHAATDERLVCTYPVGNLGATHQVMGANLTYARRFSLTALLGIFPQDEDDDGQGAGDTGQRAPAEVRAQFKKPDQSAYAAKKDGRWERLMDELAACKTAGDVDDWMRSDDVTRAPFQWRESIAERAQARQEQIAAPPEEDFPGDKPAPIDFDALKRDLQDCGTKETFAQLDAQIRTALPSLSTEQRAELKPLHAAAKGRVK